MSEKTKSNTKRGRTLSRSRHNDNVTKMKNSNDDDQQDNENTLNLPNLSDSLNLGFCQIPKSFIKTLTPESVENFQVEQEQPDCAGYYIIEGYDYENIQDDQTKASFSCLSWDPEPVNATKDEILYCKLVTGIQNLGDVQKKDLKRSNCYVRVKCFSLPNGNLITQTKPNEAFKTVVEIGFWKYRRGWINQVPIKAIRAKIYCGEIKIRSLKKDKPKRFKIWQKIFHTGTNPVTGKPNGDLWRDWDGDELRRVVKTVQQQQNISRTSLTLISNKDKKQKASKTGNKSKSKSKSKRKSKSKSKTGNKSNSKSQSKTEDRSPSPIHTPSKKSVRTKQTARKSKTGKKRNRHEAEMNEEDDQKPDHKKQKMIHNTNKSKSKKGKKTGNKSQRKKNLRKTTSKSRQTKNSNNKNPTPCLIPASPNSTQQMIDDLIAKKEAEKAKSKKKQRTRSIINDSDSNISNDSDNRQKKGASSASSASSASTVNSTTSSSGTSQEEDDEEEDDDINYINDISSKHKKKHEKHELSSDGDENQENDQKDSENSQNESSDSDEAQRTENVTKRRLVKRRSSSRRFREDEINIDDISLSMSDSTTKETDSEDRYLPAPVHAKKSQSTKKLFKTIKKSKEQQKHKQQEKDTTVTTTKTATTKSNLSISHAIKGTLTQDVAIEYHPRLQFEIDDSRLYKLDRSTVTQNLPNPKSKSSAIVPVTEYHLPFDISPHDYESQAKDIWYTGVKSCAIVKLRKESSHGDCYNGFSFRIDNHYKNILLQIELRGNNISRMAYCTIFPRDKRVYYDTWYDGVQKPPPPIPEDIKADVFCLIDNKFQNDNYNYATVQKSKKIMQPKGAKSVGGVRKGQVKHWEKECIILNLFANAQKKYDLRIKIRQSLLIGSAQWPPLRWIGSHFNKFLSLSISAKKDATFAVYAKHYGGLLSMAINFGGCLNYTKATFTRNVMWKCQPCILDPLTERLGLRSKGTTTRTDWDASDWLSVWDGIEETMRIATEEITAMNNYKILTPDAEWWKPEYFGLENEEQMNQVFSTQYDWSQCTATITKCQEKNINHIPFDPSKLMRNSTHARNYGNDKESPTDEYLRFESFDANNVIIRYLLDKFFSILKYQLNRYPREHVEKRIPVLTTLNIKIDETKLAFNEQVVIQLFFDYLHCELTYDRNNYGVMCTYDPVVGYSNKELVVRLSNGFDHLSQSMNRALYYANNLYDIGFVKALLETDRFQVDKTDPTTQNWYLYGLIKIKATGGISVYHENKRHLWSDESYTTLTSDNVFSKDIKIVREGANLIVFRQARYIASKMLTLISDDISSDDAVLLVKLVKDLYQLNRCVDYIEFHSFAVTSHLEATKCASGDKLSYDKCQEMSNLISIAARSISELGLLCSMRIDELTTNTDNDLLKFWTSLIIVGAVAIYESTLEIEKRYDDIDCVMTELEAIVAPNSQSYDEYVKRWKFQYNEYQNYVCLLTRRHCTVATPIFYAQWYQYLFKCVTYWQHLNPVAFRDTRSSEALIINAESEEYKEMSEWYDQHGAAQSVAWTTAFEQPILPPYARPVNQAPIPTTEQQVQSQYQLIGPADNANLVPVSSLTNVMSLLPPMVGDQANDESPNQAQSSIRVNFSEAEDDVQSDQPNDESPNQAQSEIRVNFSDAPRDQSLSQSLSQPPNQAPRDQSLSQSLSQQLNQPPNQALSQALSQQPSQSLSQALSQAPNQPPNQSLSQSLTQVQNQSLSQSPNQSQARQSPNQSLTQAQIDQAQHSASITEQQYDESMSTSANVESLHTNDISMNATTTNVESPKTPETVMRNNDNDNDSKSDANVGHVQLFSKEPNNFDVPALKSPDSNLNGLYNLSTQYVNIKIGQSKVSMNFFRTQSAYNHMWNYDEEDQEYVFFKNKSNAIMSASGKSGEVQRHSIVYRRSSRLGKREKFQILDIETAGTATCGAGAWNVKSLSTGKENDGVISYHYSMAETPPFLFVDLQRQEYIAPKVGQTVYIVDDHLEENLDNPPCINRKDLVWTIADWGRWTKHGYWEVLLIARSQRNVDNEVIDVPICTRVPLCFIVFDNTQRGDIDFEFKDLSPNEMKQEWKWNVMMENSSNNNNTNKNKNQE